MPGLVPGIHVGPPPRLLLPPISMPQDVDARNKSTPVRFYSGGRVARLEYKRVADGSRESGHGFRRASVAPVSPVVTPRRHGRTRSGHPRLVASRCAPRGNEAVVPRGCPEQVRARRRRGRWRRTPAPPAHAPRCHPGLEPLVSGLTSGWAPCRYAGPPPPSRHFDRSRPEGAAERRNLSAQAVGQRSKEISPLRAARSGRNDEGRGGRRARARGRNPSLDARDLSETRS